MMSQTAGAVWDRRLFLFWTVHGPFSLFLRPEKEKMGGAFPSEERQKENAKSFGQKEQ